MRSVIFAVSTALTVLLSACTGAASSVPVNTVSSVSTSTSIPTSSEVDSAVSESASSETGNIQTGLVREQTLDSTEGLIHAKHIPSSIKLFAVPLITCGVTFCLTLWVIGPVTSIAAQGLSAVFTFLNSISSVLLGAVVGGLWQVLVMFGLHWALVPLGINDVSVNGFTFIRCCLNTIRNSWVRNLSPAR